MGFLAAAEALLSGTATAAAAGGAATGFTALGTGLAAAGSVFSGLSSMSEANYRAKIANNNASILRQEADQSLQAGQTAESQRKTQVGEIIGSQEAAQGANNVDVGVGSPKQVRDSTRVLGDFDAAIIRYNAARQAYGQRVEAINQQNLAAQEKSAGKFALASSLIGGASSLAGGLGKIASQKLGQNLYGVPSNRLEAK